MGPGPVFLSDEGSLQDIVTDCRFLIAPPPQPLRPSKLTRCVPLTANYCPVPNRTPSRTAGTAFITLPKWESLRTVLPWPIPVFPFPFFLFFFFSFFFNYLFFILLHNEQFHSRKVGSV